MKRGSEEIIPASFLGTVVQDLLMWCVLQLCRHKLNGENWLYLMSQKSDVYRVLDTVGHSGPSPVIMIIAWLLLLT